MINMNKINQILDRNGVDSFQLKIINEDTVYYVPFERSMVGKSEFRKESK